MASIQSLGVGSGLLTSELVDSIIEAERAPVEKRLDQKQQLAEAKISAFGEIANALTAFDNALQSLTLPTTFNASQVSSSNDATVTGTASSLATAGAYSVAVTQLAQAHTIASDSYDSISSAVGTGTLTFRFGTTTFDEEGNYDSFALNAAAKSRTLVINSANNTLSGIRDAVNKADFGVQASIIDDGSGYRLVFSSKESGNKNGIEITATGTTGLKALNYNVNSQNASLRATTAAGSVDLSAGGGLDSQSMAFTLSYNGVDMDVVVPSDVGATTTATALSAIQNALDSALTLHGFAAGDVLALDADDKLQFQTAAAGFSSRLQVTGDGASAVLTGVGALSDGFDFSANNATFSIAVDGAAAQNIIIDGVSGSRQETVDLVNAALTSAGLGSDVVASLDDNNALIFTRVTPGTSGTMEITSVDAGGTAASAELGLVPGSAAGLDGFGLNTTEGQVTGSARLEQSIEARDAMLTVNGIAVTRSSNLVVGVITGTTLNLKSVTSGPTVLTIGKDPSVIAEKLQSFVAGYNELKGLADALTAFNPDAGENGQGSLLIGDPTLRKAMAEINTLLRSSVTGLTGGVRALADIGITTDQKNGYMLTFDNTEFTKQFATNSQDILALFATAGSATDSQIAYSSATSDTRPGTYDVEITQLATVGTYQGLQVPALGAGNISIDEHNDQFTMSVNGTSLLVTLEQGVYATATALAEHIQTRINSDEALSSNNHSVAVTFDVLENRFNFASSIYGSTSAITFNAVESTTADTLGLRTSSQGDFRGNQLGGLATPNGLSSDNFSTPVTIDLPTSFKLWINGVGTDLLTVPGSADSPQVYNSPADLMAAISAQINADPALAAQAAQTGSGTILTAGQNFATGNRAITISLDGGDTETSVLITGDASTVSFGGQTPGTLENSLAAIQDALDATALNGQVVALLDDNDQVYFVTTATGSAAGIQVTANGQPAQITGASALNGAGYDFAGANASFELDIDGAGAVAVVIDTATTSLEDTLAKVQEALAAAGLADKVTASLDNSDQLIFTHAAGSGSGTRISVGNVNATAAAQLGLADEERNGVDGLGVATTSAVGSDAVSLTVSYGFDATTSLGRLIFSTGSSGDVIEFSDLSAGAGNRLGLLEGANALSGSVAGVDVAGTINGIAATGTGQSLRAGTGNIPALPGFYLNAAYGNLASSTLADSFRVSVDGVLSDPVSLGTISNTNPASVAAGMQTAINNSPALLAAGVSVRVEYDVNTGGFGIISNKLGSSSSVKISDLQGDAGAIFGFTTGAGIRGSAGVNASGEPDPSSGLKLVISGGETGPRGSVSYIKGVAESLSTLLESYLGGTGLFASRTNALTAELGDIADKRVALEERIARSEKRLRTSFLTNDKIISQLNTTSDFLESQLEMLEGLASSSKAK